MDQHTQPGTHTHVFGRLGTCIGPQNPLHNEQPAVLFISILRRSWVHLCFAQICHRCVGFGARVRNRKLLVLGQVLVQPCSVYKSAPHVRGPTVK